MKSNISQIFFLLFFIIILGVAKDSFEGGLFLILISFLIILKYAFKNVSLDLFHPLSLFLFIGIIRYFLHGLIVLGRFGEEPHLYYYLQLSSQNWYQGLMLASIGLISLIVGWLLKKDFKNRIDRKQKISHSIIKKIAFFGLIIGILSWGGFIVLNGASIIEVALSGKFRAMDITSGTGGLFYLSLILIPSTVILSAVYYLEGLVKISWFISLSTFLLLFILGGRTRAVSTIIALVLVIWYEKKIIHKRKNILKSFKNIFIISFSVLSLIFIFSLSGVYRGGEGINAISDNLDNFDFYIDYLSSAIYTEIGQLHSLAGIAKLGGANIPFESSSFTVLLYPFNRVFSIADTNGGVYILRGLTGWDDWGFHATLIGDSFANFGIIGIIIVNIIFGYLLHSIYVKRFSKNIFSTLFYIITFIYMLRIYNESIQKYQEWFTVIFYFLFFIFYYNLTFKKFNNNNNNK